MFIHLQVKEARQKQLEGGGVSDERMAAIDADLMLARRLMSELEMAIKAPKTRCQTLRRVRELHTKVSELIGREQQWLQVTRCPSVWLSVTRRCCIEMVNPLTPSVAVWVQHPVPDRPG